MELQSQLPKEIIADLFRVSISGVNDHEKVRTHAIRSLGLVALHFDQQLWQKCSSLAGQAVDSVLKNVKSGSFKVWIC